LGFALARLDIRVVLPARMSHEGTAAGKTRPSSSLSSSRRPRQGTRKIRRSLIIGAFLCWRRAAQVMDADTALRGIAENCALSWACDHFCRSIRPPNQDAQLAQHPLPGASRNFCFCLRSAGCNRSADVWGILAVMPASSQRQLPLYGPPQCHAHRLPCNPQSTSHLALPP
jgi:hypothetical protein